ncbi:alpha/beta fold hydrolase [Candidatus Uhrbacteria bacterium]|nr:alpha/beta fold hydrolase [Candidatus Uhrbacteria bacterium]
MKTQVVVIHGGDAFSTHEEYLQFLQDFPLTIEHVRPKRDWKSFLPDALGAEYDVLAPIMPNKSNAQFSEWRLWFEKMFPFLEDGVILIGHSLGGMFLAKYLAEYTFPRRIGALLLVAAPHNHTSDVGNFALPESLNGVVRQAEKIFLFHSTDDDVVPHSELSEYAKQLPHADVRSFSDRKHLNQHAFPELVHCITDLKNTEPDPAAAQMR